MKILSDEAELFHADGRTHTTKLVVSLRNFSNATNNLFVQNIRNRKNMYPGALIHFLRRPLLS